MRYFVLSTTNSLIPSIPNCFPPCNTLRNLTSLYTLKYLTEEELDAFRVAVLEKQEDVSIREHDSESEQEEN